MDVSLLIGVFKRGASPSFLKFPLSFHGVGDKGGEVIKIQRIVFAAVFHL